MDSPDVKQVRQDKLERYYKYIITAIVLMVIVAIVSIFVEIYSINSKINSEVQQIQAAQKKNRGISDNQNGVILGYLICIGSIQPQARTTAVINSCVAQAEKSDTQLEQ